MSEQTNPSADEQNLIDSAVDAAQGAAETVAGAVETATENVVDAVETVAESVVDAGEGAVESAAGAASAATEAAVSAVTEPVAATADVVVTAAQTAVDAVDIGGYDDADVPPAVEDSEETSASEDVAVGEYDEVAVAGPASYEPQFVRGRARRIGNEIKVDEINYKNVAMLSRFLDPRGRILSRRKTRVSAIVQRRVVREIKRARHLALLPYTADHIRITRRGGRSRQR